jgi:hypothetical protein
MRETLERMGVTLINGGEPAVITEERLENGTARFHQE